MVHSRGVTGRDLKRCATANFVVQYKGNDTDKQLVGCVATELSAAKYGKDEWWVVLERA